ncbi:GNAT family N-acetyltransferase [Ensifer sp. MJa1]|uniref:GNAT family N-acetyltransferase n=1 Tax=Ensifer sp. MJa1 TaxID=2919888 RepID=UPI003009E5C5
MNEAVLTSVAEVTFRRISALTVCDVCELSETLSNEQRNMVADNGTSIAEAHFSENAWFRAIYADEMLVGFIMLHEGSDWDDGIDCPGVYLWRFMIARPFQGRGFGKQAIALVVRD